ncbi:syntaxin-12 [Nilaparvata lugens]|uniref:syntaxin-12 n=1 Tax=Nilaparvata lugens TaxID=108931 RepID=UPI00193DDF79|nr:syntaxin-12 [Nilaparvata lugens]XP_039286295.1 syntaxin-12 [Nilaparvata lugens]
MDGGFGNYSSQMNNGMGRDQQKDPKKLAQTIGSSIQKISQNVHSMKKMANLMGSAQDTQDMRDQLHQIQHYTNNLATDTGAHLKELQQISFQRSVSEQRELKMQRERLQDEFTETLSAFKEILAKTYEWECDEMKKNRANSGLVSVAPPPSVNSKDLFGESRFGDEQLIELQDNWPSSGNSRQAQMQAQADDANLQMMQQQEAAIQQLGKEIIGVNELFKELGALVHDQGELVDSIEASVEKTEYNVSQGTSQLRQASELSNKLRKKRCFMFLILAGILAFLVLIIYLGS